MTSVDIVIPAHNGAQTLGRCLNAIRVLEYEKGDVRILVVDDASTDGTARVAAEHGADVVRVDARNRAAARNAGVARSTAPLVAFVDADVRLSRQWLDRIVNVVVHPAVAGAQGKCICHAQSRSTLVNSLFWTSEPERPAPPLLPIPFLQTGACVYRRSVLRELGGFDPALSDGEDVDLGWRALAAGYCFAYEPRAVAEVSVPPELRQTLRRYYDKGRSSRVMHRAWNPHFRASWRLSGSPWLPRSKAALRAATHGLGPLSTVAFFSGYGAQRCVERWSSARGIVALEERPMWALPPGRRPQVDCNGRLLEPAPHTRWVAVPDGVHLLDLQRQIRYPLGGVEWEILSAFWEGHDLDTIATRLEACFEVERTTAMSDILAFLDELESEGLLRQVPT